MLANLFKDERCQQSPAFSILEKMYLDRIIRRSELEGFNSYLMPHQKAVTDDGNVFHYFFSNYYVINTFLSNKTEYFRFYDLGTSCYRT